MKNIFELIALFGAILIVSFSTIFTSTYVLYALTNAQTPWIMVLCMIFGIIAGASAGSFIGSHFEPVEDFCEGLAYELVRFCGFCRNRFGVICRLFCNRQHDSFF